MKENKLPEYGEFNAKVIVDTKFNKKGDVVRIVDYHNHDGGQWIMKNGIWFKQNEICLI